MRIVAAAIVVAVSVGALACSTVDNPTAPSQLRGLSLGVNGNSDNAAWVVRDNGFCGLPGSDANGNITFGGVGTVTHEVENNNKVTITCKGDNITNLSGRGQSFEGFGCGIITLKDGFVFTTDSHATVSKNGNGSLTCTFDKTV